jgi:hypothetical protein
MLRLRDGLIPYLIRPLLVFELFINGWLHWYPSVRVANLNDTYGSPQPLRSLLVEYSSVFTLEFRHLREHESYRGAASALGLVVC